MNKKRRFTTVSIFGDRTYTQALKALSATRGVEMGILVREAVDRVLGTDLKPFISFFENDAQQIAHSCNDEIKEDKETNQS